MLEIIWTALLLVIIAVVWCYVGYQFGTRNGGEKIESTDGKEEAYQPKRLIN